MKPVFQTKFGGSDAPEAKQGNCMQAAIASLFEIELAEVPDFAGTIVNGKWFLLLERWLKERNLELVTVAVKGTLPPMNGYYLTAVESTTLKKGDGHLVVCQNGQVIHDPNPHAKSVGAFEELWLFIPINLTLSTPVEKEGTP